MGVAPHPPPAVSRRDIAHMGERVCLALPVSRRAFIAHVAAVKNIFVRGAKVGVAPPPPPAVSRRDIAHMGAREYA